MSPRLKQPEFWILTVLNRGRSHGYDIMQRASQESHGDVALKVTTLYATLERMSDQGLIAPDGQEVISGRARQYFVITPEGAHRLSREVTALEHSLQAARASLESSTGAGLRPGIIGA
ncbi:PadR family transcriptional regulator [Kocuria sp.]|uniref:PadR family transcriptional regulator n=1 Tax=Kocuria sp. TaxID=1871328 RepID=UPI0026DFEEE8|nr:PadR family transcriptional regulator [Kocuria sp.]MDO5619686.1 PadR family transcriptional regulator [Kocuria sp.]